jgi:sugar lactone lactonase YvrE/5-hydroxyisourate hydrolase-like protein (transthyretin family)
MRIRRILLLIAIASVIGAGVFVWLRTRPPREFVSAVTLAGSGPRVFADTLSDPFGVTSDQKDVIYVSDGRGGSVYAIDEFQEAHLLATGLAMPSAISVAKDGRLIVANTGDHTIISVDTKTGTMNLVAGSRGSAGFRDGRAQDAQFNGPVGVAALADGTIVVADTYNDRIRSIDASGMVKTIAGGAQPGFADGMGDGAAFDTPCGVAVAADGAIIVADTGNNRIRRIDARGTVTTLAGTGEASSRDGALAEATFDEPIALAVRRDGAIVVADAGSSTLRLISFGEAPSVVTLAGGYPSRLVDGPPSAARMNLPAGLAFTRGDVLVFADSGNGLVRALLPRGMKSIGRISDDKAALIAPDEIRKNVPPRWPFNPGEVRREIAGTFGEIRGEMLPEHDTWFHSGLDVPGAYGETVRALFDEQITRPIAVEGAGGSRERLRLPIFGYIHVRIGRDSNDQMLPGFERLGYSLRRGADGHIEGVRLRRGARFDTGAAIGTLNGMNHVHLVAGPAGAEVNALTALSLPGLSDQVAPIIEDVTLTDENGQRFEQQREGAGRSVTNVRGKVRIVVRAYDQIDGNAHNRRLAPYKFAYQLLDESGKPAQGFESPRETMVFERLPGEPAAVSLVYAEGSQSGYEGRTIFAFVITNRLHDGKAERDFWSASELKPGRYTLRVVVADFFGNKSQRDLVVRVTV